ncbi:MAG TPA: hypothetical protein VE954_18665 [Oligoflexus sp.]|uniref:hypothetical protein n=1 Tax=Oligoflexus sp. TaxID=1971216 RepID=UPI002D6BE3D9|nr:hypothetical protein [Oligoflexus sp.]HYX35124.1 hypothetical protein [Oligoflexus sp.]
MFSPRQTKSTTCALLLLAAGCGHESSEPVSILAEDNPASTISWHEAAIDSTLLEVRMFKLEGEISPALSELPSGGFPVVIMSQKKKDANGVDQKSLMGFAISCKGRDPRAVARSFGEVFLDTSDIEFITEKDLEQEYKISEQPFLSCDALNGEGQVAPLFSQLYRVMDQTQKKSHILARFNVSSPLDKNLFEIGCQNVLNTFAKASDPMIPIFKENLADIPGGDNISAFHCLSTASRLPQDLSIPAAQPRQLPFDARIFKVKDDETNVSRVLLTGGHAFRLSCQAPDDRLQAAFGLPVTGELTTLDPSDAEFQDYLDGKIEEQPVLYCETPTRPDFASDAYKIVNQPEQPVPLLRLKAYQNTLVQFSCPSAAALFGKIPGSLQNVTDQSLDYLVRSYVPGQPKAKVYSIGCAASNLDAADIQKIYLDVHGREIAPDLQSSLLSECRLNPGVCSETWLEQKFVDALKKSKLDSADIVITAFAATLKRAPLPEELNYFARKFQANGMRPHSREIQDFLKTAQGLDRSTFVASLAYAFGTDYHDNFLDLWTTRRFDEPNLVITLDSLKTDHDAWIRKQFLDQNIKRVYELYFGTMPKDFQIAAVKKKITEKASTSLFQDINAMLQKVPTECVTVSPKKKDQPFQFLRPRSKLKSVTGTWSALADGTKKVGPAGHPGPYTPNNWMANNLNLGRLLIATKNSANAWGGWAGWKDGLTFSKIAEVNMIINDKKDAFGDNSGSLTACFE